MQVFLEELRQELQLADDEVPSLEQICEPKNPCETEDRLRMLDYKRRDNNIRSDIFSVSVMGLFCNISPEALVDFKKIAGEWTSLGLLSDPWLRDEKEIERKLEALCNKLKAIVGEQQTILGAQNEALATETKLLREMTAGVGMTPEQTEKMLAANQTLSNIMGLVDVNKSLPERELALYRKQLVESGVNQELVDGQIAKLRKTLELKIKLSNTLDNLAEAKDELRKKFAPKDEDDVGMLWGKVLRFMSVNMPEDANLCIKVLRKRNAPEFPPAALDAVEAYFASDVMPQADGGLLVCSFEPPATSHAIFRIGDIVTAIDDKPCRKFEDYRTKVGSEYAFYRRDAQGKFMKQKAKMPENQPRVALANLIEN